MTETPERTALYRIYGDEDLLIYIGISKDFGRRWKEHAKRQSWWGEMRRLAVDEWFDSRPEAEAAETAAIKAEKPKYNKRHAVPPPPRVRKTAAASSAAGVRPRAIQDLSTPAWWQEITLGPFWGQAATWERRPSGYRAVLLDGPRPSPASWRCGHVHEDRQAASACAFSEKLRRSRAYVGERFGQPLTLAEFEHHYAIRVGTDAA